MTGEKDFPKSKGLLIPKEIFLHWIDALRNKWSVIGPVKFGGEKKAFHERGAATPVKAGGTASFREISSYRELFLDYQSTMLPPGKTFLLRPDEELLRFTIGDGMSVREVLPEERKNRIIFGIHPCDVNAILYLDRTFLGAFIDPFYQALRENTMLIALNCTSIDRTCFCSSVGAGPYLKAESGYDMLLTDFGSDYLVEIKSKRAKEMFVLRGQTAGPHQEEEKAEKEAVLLKSFKKSVTIQSGILMENLAHPIWKRTADERCLSCGNCVMVCPTCFCHDIVDRVEMNLKEAVRYRRWDACQDLRFAEVHGGNFRGKRSARLRQFVMHKLDYEEQYGRPGTVGCGRCIRWCPTSIDLTEISKTIMEGQVEGGEKKPVLSI